MNETLFEYDSAYESIETEDEDSNAKEENFEPTDTPEKANQDTYSVSEENLYNQVTCLMPDDPTGKVIFNRN